MCELISIPITVVKANCSMRFQIDCKKGLFKFKNLMVDQGFSEGFVITDIKVGQNSQLYSTGCIPADFFTQFGFTEVISPDILQRGRFITINVQNITNKDLSFAGSVIGSVLTDENDSSLDKNENSIIQGLGLTKYKLRQDLIIHVNSAVDLIPSKIIIPKSVFENIEILDIRINEKSVDTKTIKNVINLISPPVMKAYDWLSLRTRQLYPDESQSFTGTVISSPVRAKTWEAI